MASTFESHLLKPAGPFADIAPVTPNDSADLATSGVLYVETGGALVIDTSRTASRTVNVANNSWLPVVVKRVRATGTTATGIHVGTLS